MTIHPLGCDKHGWKMTSRSSVEGQWSVSAVSRSVREQRKFTKKKPQGSSGFFVTDHVLPCKAGRMPNGILKLGYKLACMKFIYLFLLRFSWRNSLLLLIPAHPIQHLAMWQIFNKFLEYFLSFAWPYIPHNTGLFWHIRGCHNDGSDLVK